MSQIDRDAIAARAFALYVRRGRQPGRSTEDWLEAERQLKADAVAATGAPAQRSTLTSSLTSPTPTPPRPLPPAGSPREATSPGKPAGSAVPEVLASKPISAASKPGSSKPPATQLPTMKPLPMPPRPTTPPAAAAQAKSKTPTPPPPPNKKNGGKKR